MMEKIAITENALKTSGGDVFKALETASKEIYNKKIQDVATMLHVHTPRMVMDTIIHGMNLVEHENVQNKKEFLIDVLRIVLHDAQDWDMIDQIIDGLSYASKGLMKINKKKKKNYWPCITVM
jgi:hypothetical protein